MQPHQTNEVDSREVDSREVACDGGNGPLGHPRVFLNMGAADHIDCPYCGTRRGGDSRRPLTAGAPFGRMTAGGRTRP